MTIEIFKHTLFDWVEIPAGKVTLTNTWDDSKNVYIKKGESRTFELPSFAIAKYPVTNAQFAKFIDAKGYEQHKWWTNAGWQEKIEYGRTEPRFWNENELNGDLQPVVGVKWYEAVAFCLWFSEITGDKIALPTEQQWQRAAQALPDGSDSGYMYPWGDEWDCERCNNSVQQCYSNATTIVTAYVDKGDSPCGVVDMAGNVWEWCKTAYHTGSNDIDGTDIRVLRSGPWDGYDVGFFRADYRIRIDPYIDGDNKGFRLARSYT